MTTTIKCLIKLSHNIDEILNCVCILNFEEQNELIIHIILRKTLNRHVYNNQHWYLHEKTFVCQYVDRIANRWCEQSKCRKSLKFRMLVSCFKDSRHSSKWWWCWWQSQWIYQAPPWIIFKSITSKQVNQKICIVTS